MRTFENILIRHVPTVRHVRHFRINSETHKRSHASIFCSHFSTLIPSCCELVVRLSNTRWIYPRRGWRAAGRAPVDRKKCIFTISLRVKYSIQNTVNICNKLCLLQISVVISFAWHFLRETITYFEWDYRYWRRKINEGWGKMGFKSITLFRGSNDLFKSYQIFVMYIKTFGIFSRVSPFFRAEIIFLLFQGPM